MEGVAPTVLVSRRRREISHSELSGYGHVELEDPLLASLRLLVVSLLDLLDPTRPHTGVWGARATEAVTASCHPRDYSRPCQGQPD